MTEYLNIKVLYYLIKFIDPQASLQRNLPPYSENELKGENDVRPKREFFFDVTQNKLIRKLKKLRDKRKSFSLFQEN